MIIISITTFLLSLLTLLIGYAYVRFKQGYQIFKRLGIPYLEPTFPLGNTQDSVLKQRHFAYISQDFYKELKRRGHDYGGVFLFNAAAVVIVDPEFAKTILVRDFAYFVDRGVYYNKQDDPVSGNLFFIEGDEWRRLRNLISPTFTSGKMKQMFHIILSVANGLVKFMDQLLDEQRGGDGTIEMREYLARFTTDVIGSCGFGIECDSIRDPNSEFREMGKKMFKVTQVQSLKLFLSMLMPKQARALGVQFNSNEVNRFVIDLVKKTIQYRKENQVRRVDFMQLMIDLLKENRGDDGLTLEEISAQSFVFFFAGFETSSTTMTFVLYELARNQDTQERLRIELLAAGNDPLTYEQITKMEYLDWVVCETLRKYPPVATLHRIADKPYRMPDGSIVPKGTFMIVPTYALHHDSEYFPEPDHFRPERFSDAEKATRHPFAYLPFGEGPRICVGMRFGVLQAKIGLAMLLRHFRFDVCEKTEIPLQIDQINMLFVPLNGMWLRIERI